jgi:hypothetical protein
MTSPIDRALVLLRSTPNFSQIGTIEREVPLLIQTFRSDPKEFQTTLLRVDFYSRQIRQILANQVQENSFPLTFRLLKTIENQLKIFKKEVEYEENKPLLLSVQINRGTDNQFRRNQQLGRAACACTTANALISLLTDQALSSEALDASLDRGIQDYLEVLGMLQQNARTHGHTLFADFQPGDLLSWKGQVENFYADKLRQVHRPISAKLSGFFNERVSYLAILRQLATLSPHHPIGALVLIGSEFFALAIYPKEGEHHPVAFYDSHGCYKVTYAEVNPVYHILAPSLETAADFLKLRKKHEPGRFSIYDGNEDPNQITVYPLQLVEMQNIALNAPPEVRALPMIENAQTPPRSPSVVEAHNEVGAPRGNNPVVPIHHPIPELTVHRPEEITQSTDSQDLNLGESRSCTSFSLDSLFSMWNTIVQWIANLFSPPRNP